jgi:hypothetical protein
MSSSSRSLVLDSFKRYRILTIDLLVALTGLGRKNAERLVAYLLRDATIRSFAFIGNRKIYTLTAKGARGQGLDPRKHRRAPSVTVIFEHLLVAMFCAQEKQTLMTPGGFARLFPALAKCPGYRRRYFIDADGTLSLIVPDYGLRARDLARKVRRQVDDRKRSEPWQKFIYNRALHVFVVTAAAFERKARLVEKHLEIDTFPHTVVRVHGLDDLIGAKTR